MEKSESILNILTLRMKQANILGEIQKQSNDVEIIEKQIRALVESDVQPSCGNGDVLSQIISLREKQNEILMMAKKLDEVKEIQTHVKDECKIFR